MDVELACNIAWHNGYAQGRLDLAKELIEWVSYKGTINKNNIYNDCLNSIIKLLDEKVKLI